MIPLVWVLLALIFSIIFFNAIFGTKKRNNDDLEPLPGPKAFPIVGNAFQMVSAFKQFLYPFTYFTEIYGEIYRLRIPFNEIVVLGSLNATNEIFAKDETLGRDMSGIMRDRNYCKNLGIVFSQEEIWEKTRKWTVRNLRDFGFGKSLFLEATVNDEVSAIVEVFNNAEKHKNGILAVHDTFLVPSSRVVMKMVIGEKNFDMDLEYLNKVTCLMEKASGFNSTAGGILAVFFPFIRHIFPNWTGKSIQLESRTAFAKEAQKSLLRSKQKMSVIGTEPETFTDKFIQQMKESKTTEGSLQIFDELNYSIIFADLFQASSNTTSAYLESLMLYMVLYPDIQEKVYQEIESTIAAGKDIVFADKSRMIYTMAVMLEVHRKVKVVQFLVPRRVLKDFYYKKYLIKKNSILFADMNSVYNDPNLHTDPQAFLPERFIDSNGQICNQKLVIPFGVGKRNCPGELLADVMSFLTFTNIIRTFKLSTVPGQSKPSEEMHIGFTSCPHPFSIMIKKRETK